MLPKSGTYALILLSRSEEDIQVGRLGRLQVKPGFYVYVGSAFGPGGVIARVSHHMNISSHPRWHIDYLRAVTLIQGIWYTFDSVCREHQWAETLARSRKASTPLRGFGSSDCRCKSHLTFYHFRPSIKTFSRKIYAQYHDHETVHMKKPFGSAKTHEK
jgi:Uri superfamily endonuclease